MRPAAAVRLESRYTLSGADAERVCFPAICRAAYTRNGRRNALPKAPTVKPRSKRLSEYIMHIAELYSGAQRLSTPNILNPDKVFAAFYLPVILMKNSLRPYFAAVNMRRLFSVLCIDSVRDLCRFCIEPLSDCVCGGRY